MRRALAVLLSLLFVVAGVTFVFAGVNSAAAAEDEPCVPAEAWTETVVITAEVPAWTETIEHPAVTHTEQVMTDPGQPYIAPADATPDLWWNWSPDNTGGPQDYEPAFPSDERGTWQGPHENGGPEPATYGTFDASNENSGNSSWFHRDQGTPAVAGQPYVAPTYDTITVTDSQAWTEIINHPLVPAVTELVEHDAVICDDEEETPAAEVETQQVRQDPNCTTRTVTTLHQSRTAEYVWDGDSYEPGPWGEWTTVSTTVEPATVEECPAPDDILGASADSTSGCNVTQFGTAYGAGQLIWMETAVLTWELNEDGSAWEQVPGPTTVSNVGFEEWSEQQQIKAGCKDKDGPGGDGGPDVVGVQQPTAQPGAAQPGAVQVPTAVDAGLGSAAPAAAMAIGSTRTSSSALISLYLALAAVLSGLLLMRRRA